MDNANPTAEELSPTGSELEQTLEIDPPAEISEEAIKNHPLYKALEEENSAAEREKNRYKGRLDKEQKKSEKPEYVTKEDLWERDNAKDLELYGDDTFKADIENGIPKAYALQTAKLRLQSNPDKARLERQQTMASGTAVGTRNLESDELSDVERKGIADGLYSKETALAHRELKRNRGR